MAAVGILSLLLVAVADAQSRYGRATRRGTAAAEGGRSVGGIAIRRWAWEAA